MTAIVLRGDARRLPLPDAAVDLIVTSPPYWIQRDYRDGGESMPGQLGSEPTWQEWLANLVDCTAEWARVLKPAGSMFINLGDKFAAGHGGSSTEGNGVTIRKRSSFAANPRERPDLPDPPASWSTRDVTGRNVVPGFRPKSLLGLPWRYALACTDQLGLILRRDIVWAKPNGLPESVTDRCRSSHEYLFHMTLQPRYYAAVDEIREPHTGPPAAYFGNGQATQARTDGISRARGSFATGQREYNPLGKLPGSVWNIPSQPLTVPAHLGVDHFAAYPMELPRRCVLGWSPPGICVACGEGRRPVTARAANGRERSTTTAREPSWRAINRADWQENVRRTIIGYVCACTPEYNLPVDEWGEPTTITWDWGQPPTRPAVVVDPFGGTGTTALVASMLGRVGVSIDRSADYTRLARWRTTDPGERAKAMQVPKPPPIPDAQDALFEYGLLMRQALREDT